jgi:hypothetical protein
MPRKLTHPGLLLADGDGLGLASGAGVDVTVGRAPLADGVAGVAGPAEDETGLPLPSGLSLACPADLVLALGESTAVVCRCAARTELLATPDGADARAPP